MIKKKIFFLLFGISFLILFSGFTSAWWNDSWSKKAPITITETTGSNIINYTLNLTVAYDSDMQADFDDLRFLNSSETGELNYWIQKKVDSSSVNVSVVIPLLPASATYVTYIYYGNDAVSTTSSYPSTIRIEGHGLSFELLYGVTAKSGGKIRTNHSLLVYNFTKYSSANPTTCYILDSSKNVLKSGAFVGNDCLFSPPYQLAKDTDYYFVVDSGGASYNFYYSGATFPIQRYSFNWTGGLNSLGADTSTSLSSVQEVGVGIFSNPPATYTLGDEESSILPSQTSLTFDQASPQNYLTAVTPTCSLLVGEGSSVLKVNNSIISSGVSLTLGAGVHNFNCSYAGNENYSASSNFSSFTIDKIAPSLSLSISPSEDEELGIETTATGSGCPSQLSCSLFRSNASVSNPDIQTLGVGFYGYIFNTSGNNNYTAFATAKNLNITDTTLPLFSNMQNFSRYVNVSFNFDFDAFDLGNISSFYINDSSVFSINLTGYFENITALDEVELYYLKIFVNDSLNNTASDIFYVSFSVAPVIIPPNISSDGTVPFRKESVLMGLGFTDEIVEFVKKHLTLAMGIFILLAFFVNVAFKLKVRKKSAEIKVGVYGK